LSALVNEPWNNPNNYEILNAIRGQSSTTYQDRIPDADKANIDDVIHNLLSWTPGMNEFLHSLVNVIGLQIYKNVNNFENPLAKFKRGMLMTGDTIEEIMNGLLEAHRYSADSEYLEKEIFGTERPETQVNFHKINRMDYYKLSVNDIALRKAFTSLGGLDQFITNLMSTPQTSDQWDEFLVTTSLFAEWHKYSGFFNVHIDDIGAAGSTPDEAKYALRRMRELGETLPFLSRRYNPAHLPMAARPEELELIITPEANAAIDVEALSAAFNIDKADFNSRKTVVPAEYIGIPGFQAMLTTKEFFVIADSLLETRSAMNPVGLNTNYFLHHQQVISASRFAPAILFTSSEVSTPIVINATPVTTVAAPTVTDQGGTVVPNVIRGDSYQLAAPVTTNPAGGTNSAVVFSLVGAQSTRTKLFQNGFFTVALDEASTTLVVTATSVADPTKSATTTFGVVGDLAILWPNPSIEPDANKDGIFEVTPQVLTMDAATGNVIIPSEVGVQYDKAGTPVTNGSTQNVPAASTVVFHATARSGYQLATGSTSTFTFTRP
jgi:hypothetical protein